MPSFFTPRSLALVLLTMASPLLADEGFPKVEAVLQARCYECYSHASGKMKGGLTLDSRSGWEEGGHAGAAVLPGKPDESLLIRMIRWADADHQMPPKEKLPGAEIALLEEWVKRGAPDPRTANLAQEISADWWSLKPLPRPAPGTIDAFIRKELAARGLAPSPEADRATLLRRVSYDLTGLPPTPEDVAAFVNDADPRAYENRVETLLASPHYGERWARHWLDTIHFAETHGYEHDLPRDHAWRFRDYVIEALNRDTPWPRFIREQLAADRFYPQEPAQAAALGFLGAGTFDHSSFNTAPVTYDYLDRDDLVMQTMAAFASTTASCARCHAHKFDPISQEDYYALQSVFAGVVEGNIAFETDPVVAAQRARWKELLAAVERRDSSILLQPENLAMAQAGERHLGPITRWEPLVIDAVASENGSTLAMESDGSISSTGQAPDKDVYVSTITSLPITVTAFRLDVLAHPSLPKGGPGRQENGNLHLTEFEAEVHEDKGKPKELKFRKATADFNQSGWGIERALDRNAKTAWGIYPEVGVSHVAVFELAQPLNLPAGAKLLIRLEQLHGQHHLIGRFRLSATSEPAARASALSQGAETALGIPEARRNETHRLDLATHFLRLRADEELAKLPAAPEVYGAGPTASVLLKVGEGTPRTISQPKTVHILKRGDFDKPLAEAKSGALSAIHALPARFELSQPNDEAARRAALADWLAHPDNSLTWRSIANRLWHYHFGRGICDTPSDFGRMGGTPSHPELLDWLAGELRESGGSLKHLHRLIVTSATYRQSSSHRADAGAMDAENRLLWRQNRQRLDADGYRDFVLAAAGKLDFSLGGPSVREFNAGKPVQLTPTLDYTVYDWATLEKHRRGIYRFIWRGIPDPFMETLDFPDLGLLAPTRGFSASSLQSLALYNNAFVLHFSEAIAKQSGDVNQVVRTLFLREPTAEEAVEFGAYVEKHGLPALCRILLNSNEFLFVN